MRITHVYMRRTLLASTRLSYSKIINSSSTRVAVFSPLATVVVFLPRKAVVCNEASGLEPSSSYQNGTHMPPFRRTILNDLISFVRVGGYRSSPPVARDTKVLFRFLIFSHFAPGRDFPRNKELTLWPNVTCDDMRVFPCDRVYER